MKIEGDTITFSSGHTAYVNGGIVGIDTQLDLYGGYDGGIDWPLWDEDQRKDHDLTADDVRELADYMIGLWTKFKDSIPRS